MIIGHVVLIVKRLVRSIESATDGAAVGFAPPSGVRAGWARSSQQAAARPDPNPQRLARHGAARPRSAGLPLHRPDRRNRPPRARPGWRPGVGGADRRPAVRMTPQQLSPAARNRCREQSERQRAAQERLASEASTVSPPRRDHAATGGLTSARARPSDSDEPSHRPSHPVRVAPCAAHACATAARHPPPRRLCTHSGLPGAPSNPRHTPLLRDPARRFRLEGYSARASHTPAVKRLARGWWWPTRDPAGARRR